MMLGSLRLLKPETTAAIESLGSSRTYYSSKSVHGWACGQSDNEPSRLNTPSLMNAEGKETWSQLVVESHYRCFCAIRGNHLDGGKENRSKDRCKDYIERLIITPRSYSWN